MKKEKEKLTEEELINDAIAWSKEITRGLINYKNTEKPQALVIISFLAVKERLISLGIINKGGKP